MAAAASIVRNVGRGELMFGARSIRTPARTTCRHLRALAKQQGVSLNELFEEFAARAERGDAERGLAIFDKLDRHHEARH